MKPNPTIATQPPPRPKRRKAFTLPELLAVIAIMVLVMGFMGPAVNSIKDARSFDAEVYNIADILNQARDYAIANNTYAWVGFFEEKGNDPWVRNKVNAGQGRIIISTVASTDGNRYAATSNTLVADSVANPTATQIRVTQISPLYKFENIRLAEFPGPDDDNANPNWPVIPSNYQVGSNTFKSSPAFWYPTTSTATASAYKFEQIIEFSPLGEASRIANHLSQPPTPWIGISFRATRGAVDDPTQEGLPPTAILVEGLSGKVKVLMP
ncbi:MAG TPA: type II secretion system protein [Chthoniobacteraceae bacterium]|nr:type II secretion system protein [Chthoniobacteraceae bacterium]